MYLIEFSNISNIKIIEKTCEFMQESGLITKSYFVQTIQPHNLHILKNYTTHYNKLKLSEIIKLDEEEYIDFLSELSSIGKGISLDIDVQDYEKLLKIEREFGIFYINYIKLGKDYLENIDIVNPNESVMGVLEELFNEDVHNNINANRYGYTDYMFRYYINNKGEIHDHRGVKVGNILKSDLYKVFLRHSIDNINEIKHMTHRNKEIISTIGIDLKINEPWYFLGNTENMEEDIIEFKSNVINLIKNIDHQKFGMLNERIQEMLLDNRFLAVDSIKKILNGDHSLMKTDWFVKAVIDKNLGRR